MDFFGVSNRSLRASNISIFRNICSESVVASGPTSYKAPFDRFKEDLPHFLDLRIFFYDRKI